MRIQLLERRNQQSKYFDIQTELTRLVFDGLMPTVLIGSVGFVGATYLLARNYSDVFLIWLTLAMLLVSLCRVTIVYLFNRRMDQSLTVAAADRWELAYGLVTILYTSSMAASTLYNFHYHDDTARTWCTLGTFSVCSAISARLSLRPWIAKASGLVMITALIVSVLLSHQTMVRLTTILILMYTYLYCESIDVKFAIVVDQIRTKRQLAELAEHDALTGLANRRQFEAQLDRVCKEETRFAIFYIDLDKFKPINDTYGHATGDALLRDVAQRLRETVRSSDLVARLGGDEFAVLQMPASSEKAAAELAARINRCMAARFDILGHQLQIGASIGVRVSTTRNADPEVLLRNADHALYEVKKEGGGGFSFAGLEQPAA